MGKSLPLPFYIHFNPAQSLCVTTSPLLLIPPDTKAIKIFSSGLRFQMFIKTAWGAFRNSCLGHAQTITAKFLEVRSKYLLYLFKIFSKVLAADIFFNMCREVKRSLLDY